MRVTTTDKAEFKGLVRRWAEKLGARVTSISVRPMPRASYSTTGRLTFDISLLELSRELQDYVIAHELLHFHAPNHGKLWKSLMRAHLGEYEHLEGQLCRVAKERAVQRIEAVEARRLLGRRPLHRRLCRRLSACLRGDIPGAAPLAPLRALRHHSAMPSRFTSRYRLYSAASKVSVGTGSAWIGLSSSICTG